MASLCTPCCDACRAQLRPAVLSLRKDVGNFENSFNSILKGLKSVEAIAIGTSTDTLGQNLVELPLLSGDVDVLCQQTGFPDDTKQNGQRAVVTDHDSEIYVSSNADRLDLHDFDGVKVSSDRYLAALPRVLLDRWENISVSSTSARDGSPVFAEGNRSIDIKHTTSVTNVHARPRDMVLLHERWHEIYEASEVELQRATLFTADTAMRNPQSMSQVNYHVADPHPSSFKLHPHSLFRIGWDIIGLLLVLLDCFFIPLNFAWDVEVSAGSIEHNLLIPGMIYWTADICVTFNSAYMDEAGALVVDTGAIAKNYIRTWLLFDVLVLSMDYVIVTVGSGALSFARGTRAVRAFRLVRGLRLLKMSELDQKLEDMCSTAGKLFMVITLAISKIVIAVLIVAHLLCCGWYWLGAAQESNGEKNWLDLLDDEDRFSMNAEYTATLVWTLGVLTANPFETDIVPQNIAERIFALCLLLLSMVFLGCAIAKMTETVGELDRINSESARTKRNLQRYLKANRIPVGLTMRIIRFAMHSLKQRSQLQLDSSTLNLLSDRLSSELVLVQRLEYIAIHPLIRHLHQEFDEVMVYICKAFTTSAYFERDTVFAAQTWADALILTRHGIWMLAIDSNTRASSRSLLDFVHRTDSDDEQTTTTYAESTWFSEIGLFARVMHVGTLSSVTFGDAFELSGHQFAHSVKNFPTSVACIYAYAKQYLAIDAVLESDYVPQTVSKLALDASREETHQHSKKLLERSATSTSLLSPSTKADLRSWSSEQKRAYLGELYRRETSLEDFVRKVTILFPEFDSDGIYKEFSEEKERCRCMCGVISIVLIHYNDYDRFTLHQPANERMSKEVWSQLQGIYAWLDLSEVDFMCILGILAIRGIGKFKAFSHLSAAKPSKILSDIIVKRPTLLPSITMMNADTQKSLKASLDTHVTFSFGQMLQAELNPNELANLQDFVAKEGLQSLKFYLLSSLGMLCALRGAEEHESSLYLNHVNGKTVLMCIQCLRYLDCADARAIYWSYICSQAERLRMPTSTLEDLVLARLACLSRAQFRDRIGLTRAWSSLNNPDKDVLIAHFLADGIQEQTFFFAYLPDFLVNAKRNACIGLKKALLLIADLYRALSNDCMGIVENELSPSTIVVDVKTLADFCLDVKNPRTFDAVGGYITFVGSGSTLKAHISHKHLHRLKNTAWYDDDGKDKEMAYTLKQLVNHVDAVGRIIGRSPIDARDCCPYQGSLIEV